MSDLDLGAKWGDDLDENLQQIIDGYNKEMDAADKAAEKAEAAEARKQQAAAATVERLEANNRSSPPPPMRNCRPNWNPTLPNWKDPEGRDVDSPGGRPEKYPGSGTAHQDGRGCRTTHFHAGQGAGRANHHCGGVHPGHVQRPPRGNPVHSFIRNHHQNGDGAAGWAILLIQGLTAGITALIDHFKTKSDELERQAEQATERMKKRARDAAESIKKSYEAIQDYNEANRTQEINKGFEDFIKGITAEYRLQTQEIERQIQLRREEAARQKGIDTQEAELARVKLDNDFEDGKITKRQRDYGMMMIDQNLDDKIRRRDLEVAKRNSWTTESSWIRPFEPWHRLRVEDFDMKFIQGQMPSLQEVERLFQQQVKAQERIDASNRSYKNLQEEIDKSEKKSSVGGQDWQRSPPTERKIRRIAKERATSSMASDPAKSEGNAATIRINELRDLFRQSGVNFEPSYQKGTDVTSRTGGVKKPWKTRTARQKNLRQETCRCQRRSREDRGYYGGL